jgi:hypothetical protein
VIALSGGSFLVSDHLPDLSTERLDWLARLLPPMPEGLRAIDWFDERHPKCLVVPVRGAAGEWFVIVLINWASEPADLSFDLKALKPAGPFVHAVDFWGQTYMSVKSDDLHSKGIGPHGVQVLSIRMAGGPQWLGDTLHISQGLAVSRMRAGRHALDIDLGLGRWAAGRAWLELPSPPRQATLDGRPVDMRHVEGDVYVCELSFEGNASLRVNW